MGFFFFNEMWACLFTIAFKHLKIAHFVEICYQELQINRLLTYYNNRGSEVANQSESSDGQRYATNKVEI